MTSAEFARNRENFCYRHRDRQSFVLCQRCTRTICSECQTQAAVGVICPECMKDQRKAASPAQKRAQRRWGRGGRGSSPMAAVSAGRPVVTYAIAAITAFVYLLQLVALVAPAFDLQSWFAFYAPLLYPDLSGTFQPWRLVTVMLVHSGFLHLGLNMLALWMIGRIMEPLLGRGRFLALYLIGGLGGSVAVALLSFNTPVVGASGAVFGLLGALIVIGRHLGANITGILIVVGINLVIGFIPGMGVAISWQAHVGGLIAGLAVGFIYAQTRRRTQRRLQLLLLVLLAVVLIGLLLVPLVIYG